MNEDSPRIRRLGAEEAARRNTELAGLLIDCVEGGASVGFLLPVDRERTGAFWRMVAEGLAAGTRILLVAEDRADGSLLGTVQIVLGQPENQPHRGDLSKMLVHRRARRRGVGAALMNAAEEAARSAGKTLLVLDTSTEEAERLYERAGWVRTGTVPGYALMPDGRPGRTTFFHKHL
ncbi:GNAT superfamily N-acetyltransferase [Azospirillum agricola]|uniref:GNAT family N-acetyltransferase n=1 Tax=Azospirillum agricola TaxID=1720247 RepID=UPI001AE61715|nr:GNAT family N-acetyltransferase [Azospirillum agricola]MBP2229804.1 GNAT superfamily N-acetyltransferase [Azospirillum agricola]